MNGPPSRGPQPWMGGATSRAGWSSSGAPHAGHVLVASGTPLEVRRKDTILLAVAFDERNGAHALVASGVLVHCPRISLGRLWLLLPVDANQVVHAR